MENKRIVFDIFNKSNKSNKYNKSIKLPKSLHTINKSIKSNKSNKLPKSLHTINKSIKSIKSNKLPKSLQTINKSIKSNKSNKLPKSLHTINKSIKSNKYNKLPKSLHTINKLPKSLQTINKSNKSNKSNKLEKSLKELHKDLINNIILIYFFDSKKVNNFIFKLNEYNIKYYNKALNLEEINKFKQIYKLLHYNCKKFIINIKKKKTNKKKKKGGEIAKGVVGGPYLHRLVSKGDKPITGNDMKQSLKEITEILDKLRYIDEGKWVKEPNILLEYFTGDEKKLKDYIQFDMLPKYVNTTSFPPSINISAILGKLQNISSIISVYDTDKDLKKKYITSLGLDADKLMKKSKYDEYVSKISALDGKWKSIQRAKSRFGAKSALTSLGNASSA